MKINFLSTNFSLLLGVVLISSYIPRYKSSTQGDNNLDVVSVIGNSIHELHLSNLVGMDTQSVNIMKGKQKESCHDIEQDKHKKITSIQGMNITVNNVTYTINATDNSTCTPECFLNCQVHFPDPTEEKYCLINVCKCELVEEGTGNKEGPSQTSGDEAGIVNSDNNIPAAVPTNQGTLEYLQNLENLEKENTTVTTPSTTTPGEVTPAVGNVNYQFNEKEERENFYIIVGILFAGMVPIFIYYFAEMVKNWGDETIGYDYPYAVNEYKLLSDLNEGKL